MSETRFCVIAGSVAVLVACALWVVFSHFEARSYNRITGANVSTWDAMWVELRVQEGSKR
ncbi:MAG: hypothetical protein ACT4PE_05670 [Candidatus Eiseniibacteriota bacterium]